MARTILFFLIFWLVLLLSLPLLAVYYFLRFTTFKRAEKLFIHYVTSRWARFTIGTAGIRVKISGTDNLTGLSGGFTLISNHQGNFDIPVFIACLPFSPGFISKKELMKFPFLSSWMRALECLPIDRKNPRESRERIITRIAGHNRNPVFLFPEGTRSRGPVMGPFRTGTLKLLFHAKIPVLPVSISGTYNCYEIQGKITPGQVHVSIHPMIQTSDYQISEFEKFIGDLRLRIQTGLGNTAENKTV